MTFLKKQLLMAAMAASFTTQAQLIYYKDKIVSPVTIQNDKAVQRHERLIKQASSLDTIGIALQDEIQTALWAIGQFFVRTPESDRGIDRLSRNFGSLNDRTQRALLEVLHGVYPTQFQDAMKRWLPQLGNPKAFCIAASYIFKNEPGRKEWIKQQLRQHFPGYGSQPQLAALATHLDAPIEPELPSLDSLFAWQQKHGFKMVYSFQRKNRDYPGLAIVQNADGSFAKNEQGQVKSFVQLARAASNMPYFINNGNTPQGLYVITGTAISRNPFIGPTPNLQMAMMGEVNTPQFTHYFPIVFNAPPERIYRSYFPENWQTWEGLMEAYNAGKIGRSEIIAHGTTIDPRYFENQPYYPVSPTLGCLCGREEWNPQTGKIDKSDQLDLVNTFIETPGTKGYLVVIELDGKNAPVSTEEIIAFTSRFESQFLAASPQKTQQIVQ